MLASRQPPSGLLILKRRRTNTVRTPPARRACITQAAPLAPPLRLRHRCSLARNAAARPPLRPPHRSPRARRLSLRPRQHRSRRGRLAALPRLAAVEAIRLWAQERGFALPAQPEGEGVRWPCGGCASLRCCASPTRRRGWREALGTASSSSARGGSRRAAVRRTTLQPCSGTAREGVTRLNTPTRLPSALGGERAVSVAAGDFHSLALTADGSVWSWGHGGWDG